MVKMKKEQITGKYYAKLGIEITTHNLYLKHYANYP